MEKTLEQNIGMKMMRSDTAEGMIGSMEADNRQYIWGWDTTMEVARSVWGSIHDTLLHGDLVFAYRPLSDKGNRLIQLVIVRNYHLGHGLSKVYDDYGVGYITSGYTALLPHVPLRYLKDEMSGYLEEWKINKEILNTYKAIIEDLEKNG